MFKTDYTYVIKQAVEDGFTNVKKTINSNYDVDLEFTDIHIYISTSFNIKIYGSITFLKNGEREIGSFVGSSFASILKQVEQCVKTTLREKKLIEYVQKDYKNVKNQKCMWTLFYIDPQFNTLEEERCKTTSALYNMCFNLIEKHRKKGLDYGLCRLLNNETGEYALAQFNQIISILNKDFELN